MASESWDVIVNRTQMLVIGFFILVVLSVVVIWAAAPRVLKKELLPSGAAAHPLIEIIFAAGLGIVVAVLATGVLRRWRWTFWLILIAFLAGVLRVPIALVQLAGLAHTGPLKTGAPAWYVLFQGCIGLAQFGIGLVMVTGYRRGGVWGDPRDTV